MYVTTSAKVNFIKPTIPIIDCPLTNAELKLLSKEPTRITRQALERQLLKGPLLRDPSYAHLHHQKKPQTEEGWAMVVVSLPKEEKQRLLQAAP